MIHPSTHIHINVKHTHVVTSSNEDSVEQRDHLCPESSFGKQAKIRLLAVITLLSWMDVLMKL